MKKKYLWKCAVSVFALCAFTLNTCAQNIRVSVQVVDQDGLPVAGAQLESDLNKIVNTNKQGIAVGEINKFSAGSRFAVKKEGYYGSETVEYFPLSEEIKQSKTIKIELKKMLQTIPMYVKDMESYSSRGVRIPISNKKVGYDLMAGDWVAPHGNGKIADLVFLHEGVREWSGPEHYKEEYEQKITISFSNEKDGVIAWKGLSEDGRLYGSELASDYEAPLKGYQSIWQQRTWKEKGGNHQTTKDIDRNFYFRVRTKLDKDGNIISAHYGKIYGDFMSFIYYLNPTPNDRNVEFDTNKNLLKSEKVDRP